MWYVGDVLCIPTVGHQQKSPTSVNNTDDANLLTDKISKNFSVLRTEKTIEVRSADLTVNRENIYCFCKNKTVIRDSPTIVKTSSNLNSLWFFQRHDTDQWIWLWISWWLQVSFKNPVDSENAARGRFCIWMDGQKW